MRFGEDERKPEAKSRKSEGSEGGMRAGAIFQSSEFRIPSGEDEEGVRAAGRTLVIGYGNSLRHDDGVGPAVVGWLNEELGEVAGACELMECYQLTPELAEKVSGAARVIFVDASVAVHCGRVQMRRARSHLQTEPGVGHSVSPEMVLMLAEAMYGKAPPAWVAGIGVKTLAVGEGLSAEVERAGRRLSRHLGYWLRRSANQRTKAVQLASKR